MRTLFGKHIGGIAVVLALGGCSLVGPSDDGRLDGSVSLHLVRQGQEVSRALPSGARDALAAALPSIDSVLVTVFHPGDARPETARGVAFPPGRSFVDVSLIVVAENDKRVAVELFETGRKVFFGVDEDVDVQANIQTDVFIEAVPFEIVTLESSPPPIIVGSRVTVSWNDVPGATSYRVERSSTPDFANPKLTTAPGTSLTLDLPQGDHWFRVAAENPYARGDFSSAHLVHVWGAPVIDGFDPPQVRRGDTLHLEGSDLTYGATSVTIGGLPCTILGSTDHTNLEVEVPLGAMSGSVEVTTLLGSGTSEGIVPVQTIAYVTEDPAVNPLDSDWETAMAVKAHIDAYAGSPAVAIVPYQWLGTPAIDMRVFDVIIVANDTWGPDGWAGGDSGRASKILVAQANVLGIGRGGAAFFDLLLPNTLGLANAVTTAQSDLVVWDAASPLFTTPNDLDASTLDILDVYSVAADVISVDASGGTEGLKGAGAATIAGRTFSLIEQRRDEVIHLLWGFTAEWEYMTTLVGEPLFENVVTYLDEDAKARKVVSAH